MEMKFEHQSFGKRMKSMLVVDFRRMFTMPLLYIMLGTSFVIPVLVLIMTTMMDGSVSVNPQTGVETVIEGFDNVWQSIGSISSEINMMDMSLTGMCNINMMFFIIPVLVCIFVAADFRSGYSKNLFTIRVKKAEYVISKTLVGFVGAALMLVAYFVGTILGGAIAGLPFDLGVAGISGLFMCMLAKICLSAVFVALAVLASVCAKDKMWLSIIIALMSGMLLFTMIPMLTPLDSGITNVGLCAIGGILFAIGMGAISTQVLKKTSLA